MTPIYRFNTSIGLARDYLRYARDRRGVLINRAGWIELATEQVRRALAAANAMHDSERRALCLRLLNWLRADGSRHPSRKTA
jgi:hypothetical protein